MTNDQPANIPVALATVLSTGVALLAVFLPGLEVAVQGLIIAFGNAVIALGVALYLNLRTTSNTNPVLSAGTDVRVAGTHDIVTVQPTPPGPEGYEGDAQG